MPRFAVAFLFAVGIAFAQVPELPSTLTEGGGVTLTDDRGEVVGTGSVDDGTLDLVLAEGFGGFVTLSVTDAQEEIHHYDAAVARGGDVLVVAGDRLIELAELLAGSGVAVTVRTEPSVADDSAGGRGGGERDDDLDDDLDDLDDRDDDFDDDDDLDDLDDRDDNLDDVDDDVRQDGADDAADDRDDASDGDDDFGDEDDRDDDRNDDQDDGDDDDDGDYDDVDDADDDDDDADDDDDDD